jgi:demethylmenaquinone methyltransferase/2-methoxy-6-polyprenyl-1,4-benzoquinol methylase
MSKNVQNLFSDVSDTYECINSVLTLGLDSPWRKKAAQIAAEDGGLMWMDMCTGTGDMAVLLSGHAGNRTKIFSTDFSRPMINQARKKSELKEVNFALGEAGQLPFSDRTFDLVTISFATRNINLNREKLVACFSEFHRILKPEGRFVNIETSQPPSILVKTLLHQYVKNIVTPLGYLISGSKQSYRYLAKTIPRFYDADSLSEIMYESGFSKVEYERMSFGIVAIHKGIK